MTERTTNMEKTNCELQGEIFPNGSVTCRGDQCMKCSDGNWSLDNYEFTVSSIQD
jgi:hypothetical protein